MKRIQILSTIFACALGGTMVSGHSDPRHLVPDEAPRTWILHGQQAAFAEFSQGEGAAYFETIKADLDAYWMDWSFPDEPATYGDPEPSKRTSEMVDKWRAMQDLTGQVTGVAEAATLVWLVTGETVYLEKARDFLLGATSWDPLGSTGIDYNDEAHFRLFRKLPQIYDQLRPYLTAEEKQQVLEHLSIRGNRNMASILERGVAEVKRNSVEKSPPSHSVRFMPMTGHAALALWDDLPEARDWFDFVYHWYRDVFTPWGGDDGGWAEGPAYWRGVYEHAVFQDALLAIGDSLAYNQPFWRNTGYFQVYFVQPYPTTGFGDLSNGGQFNMEPGVKHFLDHLARVNGDGHLIAYTQNYEDARPLPRNMGMKVLYRAYPVAAEYWVREFIASDRPMPEPASLTDIPGSRHFRGIGWVAMHSALGQPEEDIMLAFKSSLYGSFSHSHGDQNSFILNAYGEQLAINSGYREYHRSQMHKYYTRHTVSKNNILISRRGQEVQDKTATGRISRFETGDRYVWTTGDATVAFNTMQARDDEVRQALRDIVFVDNRYFIIRDHVRLRSPGRIDWLLHARGPFRHDETSGSMLIEQNGVYLHGRLHSMHSGLQMKAWTGFEIEPDPKYKDPVFIKTQAYLREPAVDQAHFQANTKQDKDEHIVFAILWPSRSMEDGAALEIVPVDAETIEVIRPDGKTDRIVLNGDSLRID
ncbi:MAG: DUF4962 domain-containing protein [Puniceicoccaceae bacterium]